MKIIDRYIGKEILVTTLFAVLVLSLVLGVANILIKLFDLILAGAPLSFILTTIGSMLPMLLTYSIPWGILTAVLLVFGRLSAESELVALKSSGVSIPRLCLPLWGIAAVACAACFWINVSVAPRSYDRVKNATRNMAVTNPLIFFASDQVIDEFPGKRIYVGHKEGRRLFNVVVFELNSDNEPVRIIQAREARLETDPEHQQVIMELIGAQFEQRDQQSPQDTARTRDGIYVEQTSFPISLAELAQKNKTRRGMSQMTLEELLTNSNPEKATAAQTEVHRRLSLSLATLAFALIGVPLGVTAQRKETAIGFLLAIIVAFCFFFFIELANHFRNNPGAYPHLIVWAPNALFGGLGLWLFYRLSRK